jgi:hypothetical protein
MFPTGSVKVAVPLLIAWILLRANAPVSARSVTVQRGDALPIYLHTEALAEAGKPAVELAGSGGFWMPGPERLRGWALRDLRDYLQKLTGAMHPLTAADPKAQTGIVAGTFTHFPDFKPRTPEARKAFISRDPEAFVVEVQGDKLYLLGRTDLGLIAGVYTLLDRLGCRWFAPGAAWENVPELNGLTLDEKLNVAVSGPSYQARYFFSSYGANSSVLRKGAREHEYALWCLRNRMGGSAYTASYHNDPAMVPPELYAKHPELFAMANGKRNAYGLSRANPDTIALAVKSAVKYLRDNAGKGSYYESFSVETNDGSPACEESLKRVGNHSATDLNYWFANQVAAGIEKAGLKDKWVGMCSYSDHAGIPSFALHPRVAVAVTTGLDFSSGGLTVEQRLDGLREKGCRRLGIYDYLNLITWSVDKPGCSPAADPLLVAANLKRWHAHGATTYLAETSDSWVSGGPGHYLAARLLWDVRADASKERDAYYAGAFGAAAAEVRALNEDWAALPLKVKMPPGALPGLPKITREKCARWHAWITRAETKVKDTPSLLARLIALKRYYLYLNLTREYELDLVDPKLPSKQERYVRLMRYVGANRGEGAFHALGLFVTLLATAPHQGFDTARLPREFQAIAGNISDEEAWRAFSPLKDAEINRMFATAELPVNGPAGPGTFDPRLRVLPGNARPRGALKFPKLHGPPAVARQYVLRVATPTPKLTFDVVAGSPHGPGMPERTCVVTDGCGNEIKRVEFPAGRPARFDLTDLKPGVYMATFPEFGAEQVTVAGGNILGAVRAPGDGWGFNPMRRADQKDDDEVKAYFVVPAGWDSLSVRLAEGAVALGFEGGAVIAVEVRGAAKGPPQELKFAPSDKPRIAYLQVLRGQPSTIGLIVEGVTLYSPEPSSAFYETLEGEENPP